MSNVKHNYNVLPYGDHGTERVKEYLLDWPMHLGFVKAFHKHIMSSYCRFSLFQNVTVHPTFCLLIALIIGGRMVNTITGP